MDKRRFSSIFIPGVGLYLLVVLALAVALLLYNPWAGSIGLVLFAYLLYYNRIMRYRRTKEVTKYIENLNFHVESATKDTLLNFPLPLVVVEVDGTIIWNNTSFGKLFTINLLGEKIQSLVEDLEPSDLIEEDSISKQVSVGERKYTVLGNVIKIDEKGKESYIITLYWIDETELHTISKKYEDEKPVVSIITIDNYDEVMQNTEDSARPQVLAEIDKRVNHWIAGTNGILKKFERDKYLFIFETVFLEKFIERKFEVLDSVREISVGNKIPVTLTIGIGIGGSSLHENAEYARTCIDIALGRGGDQAIIKDREKLSFIGGKTKELEKRTRVRARVIAYALKELILNAEEVIIMGHEHPDMDSIGAALGLYRAINSLNRPVKIVLNSYSSVIENLLSKIRKEEEYNDVFISRQEALELIDRNKLLIVVDTHRPSFTECPELLDYTERVVVIDHHRRGPEYIEDATLYYQEPYASSCCELVTELLQYIDEKISLNPIEAEAMYAGIAIDTKNFTFKTGVRTFEAASYLRKAGVDTSLVKQLFQNDLQTYIARSNVVKNAEIVHDVIAVSVCPTNLKDAQLIVAQSADELLSITGITSSFVLCNINNSIVISGRSLGDINVQVILEKLGGGGHLSVAGAQLSGVPMKEAKKRLFEVIDEYMEQFNKKAEENV